MSEINASAVASLRSRTGVSILECKKALEETNGDEEKAIEILRKKGSAQAAKKAERTQSEGSIFMHQEDGKAAIVFLRCETDFVARDDFFISLGTNLVNTLCKEGEDAAKASAETGVPAAVQKLGENITVGDMRLVSGVLLGTYLHSNSKIGVIIGLEGGTEEMARDVAMHAAAMNPEYVSPEDVSAELIESEKAIWTEQLSNEGKPEEIMGKIMIGKEKKFREESALITQSFVKEPDKTVQQYLDGATVSEYARIAVS
ncbi:translation elongation factor Ts [Candidatus Peregrinibacteria bacterium]|jgi:elongation factor Ts|nr:translation elongation factor Ts [Candidatus Peregrinibacteria bacterium]MBT3598673.1 translation elongation factor Ts [Candidatus Peregrinibacteria bacterium]MBT4367613.1 translation elongation factor Ts [Candidatus Peregrinibacteria bacterium]MBT4585338.1 translation elongation factor Ts [Candidatus Peregrinibacteria bacterium]MBT6730837.1 translation elongation factor Ts [Candidatus Peregrinibacteria bacterium]